MEVLYFNQKDQVKHDRYSALQKKYAVSQIDNMPFTDAYYNTMSCKNAINTRFDVLYGLTLGKLFQCFCFLPAATLLLL